MIKFLLTLIALINIFATTTSSAEVVVTLEHAKTPSQLAWGLMQRHSLPQNHGMLFHFRQQKIANMWMFNCYMDLSVAFLDRDLVIQEIRELKAYPEKMDPRRPVLSLRDINSYRAYDPIIEFYRNNTITSSQPTYYALEMNAGWFTKNRILPGDRLYLSEDSTEGYFSKAHPSNEAP